MPRWVRGVVRRAFLSFNRGRKKFRRCQRDDEPAHCPAVRIVYDLRCMKRTKPKEVNCPACKGTGFQKVKQPRQPGRKIFPARCTKCFGKGRQVKPDRQLQRSDWKPNGLEPTTTS